MTVEYQRRLEKHYDELKWLYCELYPNGQGRFEELCAAMEQWYKERNKKWKALDRKREKQKDWYKSQKMLGMMLCGCRLPHGTAVPWNDGRSGCPL